MGIFKQVKLKANMHQDNNIRQAYLSTWHQTQGIVTDRWNKTTGSHGFYSKQKWI